MSSLGKLLRITSLGAYKSMARTDNKASNVALWCAQNACELHTNRYKHLSFRGRRYVVAEDARLVASSWMRLWLSLSITSRRCSLGACRACGTPARSSRIDDMLSWPLLLRGACCYSSAVGPWGPPQSIDYGSQPTNTFLKLRIVSPTVLTANKFR